VQSNIKFSGIFSKNSTSTLGTGMTKRKAESTTYWLVKSKISGEIIATPLDSSFLPTKSGCINVDREALFDNFCLEPKLSYEKISMPLLAGDNFRKIGHYKMAEKSYCSVKSIDEENIRANFGLGIIYFEMNKGDKAEKVFYEIMRIEEAFCPEHKHLFNEFGLELRKKSLFDKAIEYYGKALNLCNWDDNLHFNIARVYYECGDTCKCKEHLETSLQINPDNVFAQKFNKHITNNTFTS